MRRNGQRFLSSFLPGFLKLDEQLPKGSFLLQEDEQLFHKLRSKEQHERKLFITCMYNGIHLFLKSKSENPCHAVLVYDNQLSTCQTCGLPSLLWSIYLSHSKFSLSFDINNNNHPWSIRIYVTPRLLFPFSDWDPNLRRQLATFLTSSSFAEMGIRVCWCNMETDYRAVRLGQSCREIRPVKSSSTSGLAKFRWEVLWMKFKKEMKKMFEFVSPLQVPYYNSYTYSQNFDQGFAWEEPDNLSRSFSVRFADPSRRLLKKTEM